MEYSSIGGSYKEAQKFHHIPLQRIPQIQEEVDEKRKPLEEALADPRE